MVGVVEAIDAPGSDIKVGDQVLALAPGHRAMAEYYLAPVEHVIPLPDGLPIEQLLQAQQMGTVFYASQRLPERSHPTRYPAFAAQRTQSARLTARFAVRRAQIGGVS